MFELRDYQEASAKQCVDLLNKYKIAYLSMEVRLGKTFTALHAANLFGAKNVLFLTKKKAVESGTILNDYNLLAPNYSITITNNESLHKVTGTFDLLIVDESHRLAAFPKPNKTAKEVKKRFGKLPIILLSGTMHAESASQIYHQFWISYYSPFKEVNFYKWANNYVDIKLKHLGSFTVKDYSGGRLDDILKVCESYILRYSQEEAGFISKISENIIEHEMNTITKKMVNTLLKDRIIRGESDIVLADTPAKLMNKIHQLENGTVILESGLSIITDKTKALLLADKFKNEKIAIFYYFQKELELLKEIIPNNTTDLNEFNTTNKNLIIQQYAGAEGISLKAAKYIVYYNFGYSGVKYIQSRARLTTKDRLENTIYFIFPKGGLNSKIYKTIKNKKTFSESIFKKEYNLK